jgi:hypothetical protein
MIGLLGCQFCGVVAREDSINDGGEGCTECGRPINPVSLADGRALVLARRRAERRRSEMRAASDVGLQNRQGGAREA